MREYPGPLFRANANADSNYTFLRDHPRASSDRELAEGLWSSYWPYADTEFYNDITRDFVARFWEMDVACELLGLEFALEERRRHGPDICVSLRDQRLWIEAVAPKDGDGPNASPDLHYHKVSHGEPPRVLAVSPFVGEDGILLRLRQAIQAKLEKYQDYCADRIIQPRDFYVIAINGSRVSAAILEEGLPWIVQSVYPFGAETFKIDVKTETFTVEHAYRPSVHTATKNEVATDIFLKPEYAGISGILFSRTNARNRRRDFVFVHNLRATNRLERGWLQLGTEYWPDSGALHVTRHSDDQPE